MRQVRRLIFGTTFFFVFFGRWGAGDAHELFKFRRTVRTQIRTFSLYDYIMYDTYIVALPVALRPRPKLVVGLGLR